ncbi:RHS repeat domain-containing protein [Parapedobacter koreensis]|uniref:RHS repeat-associated core domain-containing protein n=1 Tax=Parapedobacter koreensis TaxID=332977 RepID=A0A1H7UEV5_9SPHI|nr:DUF6443 domain-containing protein [Parapedobacter koreensis]SEL95326.1 RHS repeat-associated core domain-containing protein [Parapedobacter koreensis]
MEKKVSILISTVCWLAAGICGMPIVFGQLQLSQPQTTGIYSNNVSITLKPGFQTGGPFHAFIAAPSPVLGAAATGSQNHIQVTRYLKAFSTPPSLTITDAMRDIEYFDGLGRPSQQVGVKAANRINGTTTTYSDLVTPVVYDAYGRQDREYLPFATATGVGGAFKNNAVSLQAAYYNAPPTGSGVVQIPVSSGLTPSFAQRKFEPSPLMRTAEQGFAGLVWQPAATRSTTSGRTVQFTYSTNNGVALTLLANTKGAVNYGVSVNTSTGVPTLTVNGTYAENELHVTVTKDENSAAAQETFYGRIFTSEEYTDKLGRVVLRRTFNLNNGSQEMLSTYYVYDNFGNLTFVLPPGINPDNGNLPNATQIANYAYQYQYDKRNRLVEKQLPGKEREYMVYNKQDLVVATQDGVQRAAKSWTVTKYDGLGRVVQTGIWNNGGTAITRQALQTIVNNQSGANAWEERTGTAYTNRAWPSGTSAISTVMTEHFYDDYNVGGLQTIPAVFTQAGYSKMTMGKPTLERVLVLGSNPAVYLWTVNYYDDKGQVVRQFRQHYLGGTYATSKFDDIATAYSFTGLVTETVRKHHTNNAGTPSITITTGYNYDNRDRLIETWKTVSPAGTAGTRTLIAANTYNEVGQLMKKQLHKEGTTAKQTVEYTYNERGWLRTASAGLFAMELRYNTGSAPRYNGDISSQHWGVPNNLDKSFTYSYDNLSRLKEGVSTTAFSETGINYDKMGNITSLKRGSSATQTYTYTGNRLSGVSGGVSRSYTYDANGNVHTDGTNTFTYNYLNLIAGVTGPNATTYTYDATGRKLRRVKGSQSADYIDGIQYSGGNIEFIQTEEGRAYRLSNGTYNYEYTLTDHLGNARVSFDIYGGTARKIQSDDYFPFGLAYNSFVLGTKNNYLYNGKELQDGLNQYDYGARFYDPVIGRWGSVDPLAESFQSYSPYNYGLNNPIIMIDPTGMAPWSTHTDEEGNVIAVYDDGDLGVYKHSTTEIHTSAKTKQRFENDIDKQVGVTFDINSFQAGDKINFNSFEAMDWINNFEANQGFIAAMAFGTVGKVNYAFNARNGGVFDPKSYMKTGSQISEGVFFSPRDLGNYAAGAFGRISGMDKRDMLVNYGAFQLSGNNLGAFIQDYSGFRQKALNFDGSNARFRTYGEDFGSNLFQRIGFEGIRTLKDFTLKYSNIWKD